VEFIMAKTENTKKVMERVTINGTLRTEKLRLADLMAILNGEQRDPAIIDDLKAYVAHKQEQNEARKTSSKVDKEKAAVREHIRKAVVDFLTENEGWFTTTEIIKKSPALGLNDYSVSAVANVLTALKGEGIVVNEKDKKASVYTLAK
jgi:hypothetical protein